LLSWKKYVPKGTRDLLFDECTRKIDIINALRNVYIQSGFQEVSTPTLEFYDVFHLDNLSIDQEKMYKLFDNSGRILVLRPDMTTPLARVAATRLKGAPYPLRICYSGNIFRMNESWGGKFDEITQSGIEILGSASLTADSEIIITAIKSLLAIGISDFEIELGHANFFKSLIDTVELEGEALEILRRLVENKNFTALNEFVDKNHNRLGGNSEILKKLPELFGSIKVLDKAQKLTSSKNALLALEDIAAIYKKLSLLGLSKYISIDLGMVQHIDYYTGITFRAYSRKVGNGILSGGRYDKLTSQFGEDMPATGFGINIDNIMVALQDECAVNDCLDKYLISYTGNFIAVAYNLADKLRNSGCYAEISLIKEEESMLNYCKARKIDALVSISSEETLDITYISSGTARSINTLDFLKGLGE
jgi:ATP phosphoribosyltransferase regulatory subunit